MINHIRIMSRESGLIVSFGGDTPPTFIDLIGSTKFVLHLLMNRVSKDSSQCRYQEYLQKNIFLPFILVSSRVEILGESFL